jgi:ABC-type nitrate/sulfonate/bicarbonate transport system ATPase subunit
MATAPGRIAEIVTIDLPRPRDDQTRRLPRFVDLTNHVWDRLRAMRGPAGEPAPLAEAEGAA